MFRYHKCFFLKLRYEAFAKVGGFFYISAMICILPIKCGVVFSGQIKAKFYIIAAQKVTPDMVIQEAGRRQALEKKTER